MMEFLTALWLPILASAVAVFLVSSVMHMVLPTHRNDYRKLPGEERIMEVMREQGVTRGQYVIPHAKDMKDMNSPEMIEKYDAGPVAMITVMNNGKPMMGRELVFWFVFSVLVSIFAGYVAYYAVGAGAGFRPAFRFTGTVAVIAYALIYVPDSIWKAAPWSNTIKYVLDGLVYGLVTAAVFGWLWPGI